MSRISPLRVGSACLRPVRQAQWFLYFHGEQLPSAIKRYQAEIHRVFGVLEDVLSERDW